MLKKTITIPFVLLLFVLFSACSNDDGRRPRMSPQEQAQQLKDVLDLTDQQVEQLTKIYTDMREEFSRLRDESGGERAAMREAYRDLREETESRINAVLTDEQKEKYQTYQQEQRERRRDRRDRREGRE